jgi:hypothetical protein
MQAAVAATAAAADAAACWAQAHAPDCPLGAGGAGGLIEPDLRSIVLYDCACWCSGGYDSNVQQ